MAQFSSYKLILIVFMMTFLGPLAPVFADKGGAGTGGGGWSEGDFKHMLERLSQYIYSPAGQNLYPEVAAFDNSNKGATLKTILQELNPHIVKDRVFDQFGNERDCVSGNSRKLGRYFKCNANTLPKKPGGNSSSDQEFYGSMYRLCLHEAFVQAELEKPVDKELPSVYPLASRLMVHLENFPEWVPGVISANQASKVYYGSSSTQCQKFSGIIGVRNAIHDTGCGQGNDTFLRDANGNEFLIISTDPHYFVGAGPAYIDDGAVAGCVWRQNRTYTLTSQLVGMDPAAYPYVGIGQSATIDAVPGPVENSGTQKTLDLNCR